jgi:two-component sensor histidine kinase/putative methionine-R-sulfoxide reductase with GAF domain
MDMTLHDTLAYMPAHEQLRRFRAREISPVDVLEAQIRQIEAHDDALRALTQTHLLEAHGAAWAAEARHLRGTRRVERWLPCRSMVPLNHSGEPGRCWHVDPVEHPMPHIPDKPESDHERALAYQRALASFSRMVGEPISPDRLMQNTAAHVSRVTGIRHVKILRYRPDVGDLLVEAGVGWKPGVVGNATLATDHRSPGGRSIQTASPVVIEDLPNDPEYRYSELLRDHGVVSVLNVPLMIDGKTWGVLEIDADEPTHFGEHDCLSLMVFANVLGLALSRENAQSDAVEAMAENSRRELRAEVLLRELQHRVKNNFQIILAFLGLQQRQAETDEARQRIGRVMDRVFAIGLAHDQLSLREGDNRVDFADYLRALCANIDPGRRDIVIHVMADRAVLPLDRAVPAGLVVNELVTNSVKYAFGEGGGTIRVSFQVSENIAEACLTVEDDGRGMVESSRRGSGLSLVENFANQLGGRVEQPRGDRGTRTLMRFPYTL